MSFQLDFPMGPPAWHRKMRAGPPWVRNSDNTAGDQVEVALDQCLIPAGVVQPGSILEVIGLWGLSNNSATNTTKTLAYRMDSNPISAPPSLGTAILTQNQSTNISGTLTGFVWFESLTSQWMLNGGGALGGSFNTNALRNTAVDFSVDRIITFDCVWALAQAVAQSITLAGWMVNVYR